MRRQEVINKKLIVSLFIFAVCIGTIWYFVLRVYDLETVRHQNEASIAERDKNIADLSKRLADTEAARDDLSQKLNNETVRVGELAGQVSEISGAVGTIQKTQSVDPQLLQKYSKIYFLNENYVPSKLAEIPSGYLLDASLVKYFHGNILPFLTSMMNGAASAGVELKILSAFRSFGEQANLKTSYKITYGAGANKFSADQGYSEHQLGSAVDFTTEKIGENISSFEKTDTFNWLETNAWSYGFILSYPKNNSYYIYEPWHWRFVGKALSKKLHEENKNFYDLDQREIDQYRVSFFDN